MKVCNKYMSIVFIIFLCMNNAYAEDQYKKFGHGNVVFSQQNLTMEVEVATTKMQRTVGLMFREDLAPNSGMLFVFEQVGIQKVWMRYTLIPLDVIFISAQGNIVSMLKNLQPCEIEPCEIHESTGVASYMLEVNAGMLDRNKIGVGQQLLFFL